MDRNALHPDRIARRLPGAELYLQNEVAEDVPRLIDSLRNNASHYDEMADIWGRPERGSEALAGAEHIVAHYRRIARRLRETASAIERDHAAGPWISLDQPFVHLGEAAPARQESGVAH